MEKGEKGLSKQIKNRVATLTKASGKLPYNQSQQEKQFIRFSSDFMNYLLVKRGLTFSEMKAYIKDSMETGIRIVKESRA